MRPNSELVMRAVAHRFVARCLAFTVDLDSETLLLLEIKVTISTIQRMYSQLSGKELDEEIEELLNVDLIVSAMGDWSAENALNRWHLNNRQGLNIIYGWTEDHALAGSAAVISSEGGCLACGIDRIGNLIQPLTTWPTAEDLQTEPSCADHYRPYGAIELANITNMISRVVVDELASPSAEGYRRNWIGPVGEIIELGGSITPWANKIVGRDSKGELMAMSQWPSGPCRQCGDPGKKGPATSKELEINLD